MPRSLRTLSAVCGAAGILLAIVAMPPAALAAGSITITSAGPDASNNPYNLTVVANDLNNLQISSMTAHVFDASNQDVADAVMTYVSGTPDAQTWVASPAIDPSVLPPGTYTVTVDASDTSESDPGLPAPGSFSFQYATAVTAMASPPSVTAGSQQVTFTGTVLGTPPSGPAVGLNNVPVLVSVNGGTPGPATTTFDSAGDFTYTVTNISATTNYTFSVAAGSDYTAASSPVVPVGTSAATTTMNVTASPTDVSQGASTVTFTGTVTAQPQNSTTSVPLAGVPVNLVGSLGNPAATTDQNGHFTYQVTGVTQAGDYQFSVDPTALYTGTSAAASVGVAQASTAITVTPSVQDITFGSQDVTLSGPVTVVPSGQTSQVSIGQGITVDLSINGGAAIPLTTDSKGFISYQANGLTAATDFSFSLAGTSLYTSAVDDVKVPLNPGQTQMTVTANPPDVNLDSQTVTFSGTVTVTPAGSTTPVGIGPNVPVDLAVGSGSATQVTTTNDAAGDFTVTINNISRADTYHFSVPAGTFYSPATFDVPIGLNMLQTSIAVTPSQNTVTQGSQNVTFTGNVSGTPPGGGAPLVYQHITVNVSVGTILLAQLTTDASGNFSYQAIGISQATDYTFSVAVNPTIYTAATADVPIGLAPAQTRITGISLSPTRVKYGRTVTLTGTVQYLDLGSATWVGLADANVALTEGNTSVGTASSGSGGGFTTSLPTTNGAPWSAKVAAGNLIQQATAIGNLDIYVPLTVKSFGATLTVNKKLSATGCLLVTVPVKYAPQTSVQIQYRAHRSGPWRVLGRIQLHNVPGKVRSCPGANESYFSGSIRARLANAYYRAFYPADAGFTSAASKPVHAWRYPTRIVSYSVTPHAISANGKVTISGRLQVHGNTWTSFGGQLVKIVYNDKGTNFWQALKTVRTDASGWFTLTVIGGRQSFVAVIYAQYLGDKTHLATQSPGIDVVVNGGKGSSPQPSPGTGQIPATVLLPIPYDLVLVPGPPPLTALLRSDDRVEHHGPLRDDALPAA